MTETDTDVLAAIAKSVAPEGMIETFLHDPPDKALAIPGQQSHAARYLTAILGDVVDVEPIKANSVLGDQLSAIAERPPMPSAGPNGERAVGPAAGKLRAHDPVGDALRDIPVPTLDQATLVSAIPDLRNNGMVDPCPRNDVRDLAGEIRHASSKGQQCTRSQSVGRRSRIAA